MHWEKSYKHTFGQYIETAVAIVANLLTAPQMQPFFSSCHEKLYNHKLQNLGCWHVMMPSMTTLFSFETIQTFKVIQSQLKQSYMNHTESYFHGHFISLDHSSKILYISVVINNLSHLMTKPTKWYVRPAKTQISLGIRPVWSVFAVRMKKHCVLGYPLSAQWRLWSD